MVIDESTELRRLRPAELYNLAMILDPSESWKKLVSVAASEGIGGGPKFNGETVTIIERASRHERKPPAAVFLEEWATMGRERPTLGLLLDLLVKAQLLRGADYLAREILKVEAPARPSEGPAVPVDVEGALAASLRRRVSSSDRAASEDLPDLARYPVNLSGIDYPVHLLAIERGNGGAVSDGIGIDERRVSGAPSTRVLDFLGLESAASAREPTDRPKMSDMIEFSAPVSSSDLINFQDSCTEGVGKTFAPTRESSPPNVSITRGDRESCARAEAILFGVPEIREMASQELPAILKDFRSTGHHFHRELSSSELPLCINGVSVSEGPLVANTSVYSWSSSLPNSGHASIDADKKKSTPTNETTYRPSVQDSAQLPVTLLQFQRQ